MSEPVASTRVGRWKLAAVIVLALVTLAVVAALAPLRFPSNPTSLGISGYTGRLGEWELAAALVQTADGKELAGPLTVRHVGICTQDGPQEKTGEMRVRLSTFSPAVVATIALDGVECSYRGPLSETHIGELVCPDRRPAPITLWTR